MHTHTRTHPPPHTPACSWGCGTHPGWGRAGAAQGLGHLDAAIAVLVSRQPKKFCLWRGGLLCTVNKYCGPFPAGGSGSFWVLRVTLPTGIRSAWGSDPEPRCRCGLEQSGLWLCCWPQQCAFVGVTGPGRGDSPWAPNRREGAACLCICGPAALSPEGRARPAGGTRPCPPRTHYSEPSALSASSLGRPAPFQPRRPCPAGCPCTGEVVERCPGTQRCPGELLRGPCALLSPTLSALELLLDSIHPGERGWVFPCIPLQLQPALSKFLCLMQGGETTQNVKGKSPWGTELLGRWQALPLSTRVTCRPSWAVGEQL